MVENFIIYNLVLKDLHKQRGVYLQIVYELLLLNRRVWHSQHGHSFCHADDT